MTPNNNQDTYQTTERKEVQSNNIMSADLLAYFPKCVALQAPVAATAASSIPYIQNPLHAIASTNAFHAETDVIMAALNEAALHLSRAKRAHTNLLAECTTDKMSQKEQQQVATTSKSWCTTTPNNPVAYAAKQSFEACTVSIHQAQDASTRIAHGLAAWEVGNTNLADSASQSESQLAVAITRLTAAAAAQALLGTEYASLQREQAAWKAREAAMVQTHADTLAGCKAAHAAEACYNKEQMIQAVELLRSGFGSVKAADFKVCDFSKNVGDELASSWTRNGLQALAPLAVKTPELLACNDKLVLLRPLPLPATCSSDMGDLSAYAPIYPASGVFDRGHSSSQASRGGSDSVSEHSTQIACMYPSNK